MTANGSVPEVRVVKRYKVPLMTKKGLVWAKFPQSERMSCELCEMFKLCEEAVRHMDFVACEKPLEKELL